MPDRDVHLRRPALPNEAMPRNKQPSLAPPTERCREADSTLQRPGR